MFTVMMCGLWLTLGLGLVKANNIAVTNIGLSAGGADWCYVQFDISWDNSWRASWTESGTWTNWDAAWVFVKQHASGAIGYGHATLGTNDSDHTVPAGSVLDVGLNAAGDKGVGVFIYRSAEGSGTLSNNTVKLRWNFGQDGVASTAQVDVGVHAIEMVYVPQGSFYAGDGTAVSIQGQFEDATSGNAFMVTSENALTLGGGEAGSLGNNNKTGQLGLADDYGDSTSKSLPAAYPKGYSAFYCMKYELTQGQYASFLNALNEGQKGSRYPDKYGLARHTITTNASGDYVADAVDRACNYLSWADGAAYADWSGLRPMTELEYEKACRGTVAASADEYAWGSGSILDQTGHSGVDGSGTNMATPANANCNHTSGGISGPVRAGIYATTASTRGQAGSTYWGIMEMSGNLFETTVATGSSIGRVFEGTTGDGALTSGGNATNADWPSSAASGTGSRGGNWASASSWARVSSRVYAQYSTPLAGRDGRYGARALRQAP